MVQDPDHRDHDNLAADAAPAVHGAQAVARPMAAALSCMTVLAACQGQTDLAASGCLPLRVPAQVVLVQEAGLYAVGGDAAQKGKALVLSAHPRNATNDDFHGTRLVRSLAPGTRLGIERLQQAWGFDVGKGRISAFGTVVPGGERFEYGWGGGTVIGRAPWEPGAVPNLRTVKCGD